MGLGISIARSASEADGGVCDRQHCHHVAPFLVRDSENHGTRAVLNAFFLASLMLRLPEIGIADDLTWNRLRKHRYSFIS